MAQPIVVRPTIFNGTQDEDLKEWLEQFKAASVANGWNEAAQLRIVPTYLGGKAARWYRTQLAATVTHFSTGLAANNEVNFTEEFEDQFLDQNRQNDWMQKLSNLRQGRTHIREFNDEFERLIEKVNTNGAWPENLKIRWYLDKIDPKMISAIYITDPTTLGDAMETAERAYQGNNWGETNKKQVNLGDQVEALQIQIAELMLSNSPNNQPRSQVIPPLNRVYENDQNTWRNNQPNNWSRNRPTQNDRGYWTNRCYNCERIGYRKQECRSNPQNRGN
jgi:hypothetical protein